MSRLLGEGKGPEEHASRSGTPGSPSRTAVECSQRKLGLKPIGARGLASKCQHLPTTIFVSSGRFTPCLSTTCHVSSPTRGASPVFDGHTTEGRKPVPLLRTLLCRHPLVQHSPLSLCASMPGWVLEEQPLFESPWPGVWLCPASASACTSR